MNVDVSRRTLPDTLWSFAGTAIRIGGGAMLLPVILATLPPAEAGAWFVLTALGTLVLRFDLGTSAAVQRGLSYLLAGSARIDASSHGENPPSDRDIASFVRTASRAYLVLTLAALIIGGVVILASIHHLRLDAGIGGIALAAVLYLLGMCANLAAGGWAAIAAAVGRITAQQRFAAAVGVLGLAVSIAGLLCGLGLPALGAGTAAAGIGMLAANRGVALRGLGDARRPGPGDEGEPRWLRQAWPMTWRVGLISLGGWLISYACTFAAAGKLGLAEAAPYGASLQILQLLLVAASIPLQVRMPALCAAFARGDRTAARNRFLGGHGIGLSLFILGGLVVVALGDPVLALLGAKTRLIERPLLAALAVVLLLEFNHSNCAVAVMAANRAPFALAAVASGLMIAVGAPFAAGQWGIAGLILLPGLVQLAWNNWYPPVVLSRLLRP